VTTQSDDEHDPTRQGWLRDIDDLAGLLHRLRRLVEEAGAGKAEDLTKAMSAVYTARTALTRRAARLA
jgi:hypothetical protein